MTALSFWDSHTLVLVSLEPSGVAVYHCTHTHPLPCGRNSSPYDVYGHLDDRDPMWSMICGGCAWVTNPLCAVIP